MRALVRIVALILLTSCGTGSSPTAPTPTPTNTPAPTATPGPTIWSGTRQILGVLEGKDTCLGQTLLAKGPDAVTRYLPPPPPPNAIGLLAVPELNDGCQVFVHQSGSSLTLSVYKCSQDCWFESFDCAGRKWSYCRSYEDFTGSIAGSQIVGQELETFAATDGRDSYLVKVLFAYELQRQ